jgi:hypothetical protein
MRITIDIDDPILRQLKRLQRRERKSLGHLASDLLAQALSSRREPDRPRAEFQWTAKSMGAQFDLESKNAVLGALDTDGNDDR